MSFCGFKKFHPHNKDSVIRVAYEESSNKELVRQHLRVSCVDAAELFKRISKLF